MQRKHPNLFSPLKLGGITLKNRIISAPMAYPDLSPEGFLTAEAAAFYELRAKGGAAVVTVSEGIVHAATGLSHDLMIRLDAPGVLPGLATTASAIKRHGAVASIELSHGGMHSGADRLDKSTNKLNVRFGPSATVLDNGSVIQEMPEELIEVIVEAFGKSAALVKKAGFEMILIHAGHGWLFQQFFSPADNHRTDKYGGSIINRARLLMDTLDAVRVAVGPQFPIEVRLSAEEYRDGSYTFENLIELTKLIQDRVDLLQISTGSHEGCFDKTHIPMFMPRGGLVHYAAEVKKNVHTRVAAIGGISDPTMAEEIITSGQADVVEMARQLLADPYWPKKAMMGQDEEILRCCRCFTCMGERMATGQRICALNPVIGHELETKFELPPGTRKTVLVAGGGPGGMEAAITAAGRGHKVILCEKKDVLGGALQFERGIPFKQDLFAYVATRALEMKNKGVKVCLCTEVTPELVEKMAPDVLIVAVGAEPVIPPIPGINGRNVISANDLSNTGVEIGKVVVILGGGLVGCESAIHLAQMGRVVTVVEMLDKVAGDANGRHRPILLDWLTRLATVRVGLRATRVTEDGLYCSDSNGNEIFLFADTIVCAVGQRPLLSVVDSLKDCAQEVVEVGDCVRPATIRQAIFRGYFAGLDI
jgi:2,4-dienoyl-CoA reductase-like NADH-dependent reductase (Old Yellow Enzyme family)/thioredoxin reductase